MQPAALRTFWLSPRQTKQSPGLYCFAAQSLAIAVAQVALADAGSGAVEAGVARAALGSASASASTAKPALRNSICAVGCGGPRASGRGFLKTHVRRTELRAVLCSGRQGSETYCLGHLNKTIFGSIVSKRKATTHATLWVGQRLERGAVR